MKNALGLLLTLIALSGINVAQSTAKNGPVEGLPRIVARVKLTNQTAELPPRVIFTPKSSGLFRVSVSIIVTVPTQGSSNRYWFPTIQWADVTPETASGPLVSVLNLGSDGPGAVYTFPAKAGTAIKLSTSSEGDVSGSAYDLFIVIERLTKIPSF